MTMAFTLGSICWSCSSAEAAETAAHGEVQQHGVERSPGGTGRSVALDDKLAVADGFDGVTALFEAAAHDVAEVVFVVHHEDSATLGPGGRGNGEGQRGRRFACRGQVDVESGAHADTGERHEGAAMLLDDGVADREPEPHALLCAATFRGKIGIEDFRHDRRPVCRSRGP